MKSVWAVDQTLNCFFTVGRRARLITSSQYHLFFQIACQVGQSIVLGYLANAFNEPEVVPDNTSSFAMDNMTLIEEITTHNTYLLAAGRHVQSV